MPVTITQEAATVAIRAATSADDIAPAVAATLDILFPAAVSIVQKFAPAAPNAVANASVVRLVAWLYEADPAEAQLGRALQVSGTAALLSQWREHRAGAVGAATAEPAPAPTPGGGGNVPDPPAGLGRYILVSDNGDLSWVSFPAPS